MMLRALSITLAFFVWLQVAAFAPSEAKASGPPSIGDFLANDAISDFALSPSGRLLVAIVRVEDRRLWVVSDLETGERLHVTTAPEDFTPYWIEWANENRVLIGGLAGQFKVNFGRYELPAGRVLAIDIDGANPVVLFAGEKAVMRSSRNLARVTDLLPEDDAHVIMPGVRGGDLDLWKVNVDTGAAERIAVGTSNTYNWGVDGGGAPAFRYDTNRLRNVTTVYSPDAGGAWRQVARLRDEDLAGFRPVAFHANPELIYVLARAPGADRAGLHLFDYRQGAFVETIAEHPKVDILGAYIAPRTKEYLGYFYHDDIFRFQFVNSETQRHVEALRGFVGESYSFSIQDTSDNGENWIMLVTGPDDPGGYYIYNRTTSNLRPFAQRRPRLADHQLGASQIVNYLTRDGVELTGYLTRPPGVAAGPTRLVVMPHGGPEVRDVLDYDTTTQFLATRGYAVFRPNFRGSGGFGKAFAEAGYGEWGGRMQDDVTDGVMHLIENGLADPERICIVGASYGGFAALAGAVVTPELYACAISINGVTDLIEQARYSLRDAEHEDVRDYIRRSLGDSRRDRARMEAFSPARQADRIEIPVLLIHGEEDDIVPIDQSERMEKALEAAGGDVRLVRIEDAGHSLFRSNRATSIWFKEMEEFLAAHLGGYRSSFLEPLPALRDLEDLRDD